MNIRKLFRYFGFNYHPFRWQYTLDYIIAFFAPLEYLVTATRPEFFIAGCVISLVNPSLMFFVILWALLSSYDFAIDDSKKKKNGEVRQVILFIQMKHLQSLEEILARDPDLAFETYKDRSMSYWCKKYNNPEAHSLIMKAIHDK